MNRGIFSFPRSGALEARGVSTQTLTAATVSAATKIAVPGVSAGNTGITLLNDADLGSLFRPASYTAVQNVTVSNSGDGVNPNGPLISGSATGNLLTLVRNTNCNCNCACSTDSANGSG